MQLFILAAPLIDTESVYQHLGMDTAFRPSGEEDKVHHAMRSLLGQDLFYHKMLELLSVSILFSFETIEERRIIQGKLRSWTTCQSNNNIVSTATLEQWCAIARDLCAAYQDNQTRTWGNSLANTLFLSGAGDLVKHHLKPHGPPDQPYFL